uniref:Cecropin CBM2 n=1 Tax=Bombyx mori TaxID=7091 RepID=Q9GSH1_BOMMO|nr:cecropin CBM2 precursor [Bombyx mori]AAG27715.1 cecropin CBM2 [Bombyx mori]
MNFAKILSFVFALVLALSMTSAAPEPRWKIFKKIEKMGRNIRDGIVKAGPAIEVLGSAKAVGK